MWGSCVSAVVGGLCASEPPCDENESSLRQHRLHSLLLPGWPVWIQGDLFLNGLGRHRSFLLPQLCSSRGALWTDAAWLRTKANRRCSGASSSFSPVSLNTDSSRDPVFQSFRRETGGKLGHGSPASALRDVLLCNGHLLI